MGGSDAYGYVNQAYDWAERVLPGPVPVSEVLPFEMSDRLQAPLGYREGRQPQTLVPTYAPGLPLVMAVALLFGPCGPFVVVPVFAALFVWFTFRLGTRTAGRVIGLVAAFVLSVSPVVLYQAVWPMSDVPAGAIWTAAAPYPEFSGEPNHTLFNQPTNAAIGTIGAPNAATRSSRSRPDPLERSGTASTSAAGSRFGRMSSPIAVNTPATTASRRRAPSADTAAAVQIAPAGTSLIGHTA